MIDEHPDQCVFDSQCLGAPLALMNNVRVKFSLSQQTFLLRTTRNSQKRELQQDQAATRLENAATLHLTAGE